MQRTDTIADAAVDFSVIIATCDRPHQAASCVTSVIDALLNCPGSVSEIIVVQNGSPGAEPLPIAEVDRKRFQNLLLISEKHRGLSNARNIGIRAARGRIFIFIDDDCIMAANYVRDLQSHLAEWPEDFLCGGRVELGSTGDLPFTIRLLDARERYERGRHPGGFIQGCNLVASRCAIETIGVFDTRFGAGTSLRAAEDTDLIVRAILADICVECVADMCVYHFHGRSTTAAVKQVNWSYSYGNGALYAKYGFREFWLLKFFYWTVRSAIRETFGGPKFNAEADLSFWPIVFANVRGAFGYWTRQSSDSRRKSFG